MVLELSRSRSVVSTAHVQAFIFFTAKTLSRPHGRLPDKHIFQAFAQKLAHALDSLVRTAIEKGAEDTSNRADACAFTGDPQLSSYRRRFQTGRLLGPCLETLLRNWHSC